MKKVKVLGYRDKYTGYVINTTSKSINWSKGLSPFYVGPVNLYGEYQAQNIENGWQFSKLYSQYADKDGNPTEEYYKWAENGWKSKFAYRYPMGKGAIPLCSIWNKEKLGYIEARKKIYLPLYAKAVVKTPAFKQLQKEYNEKDELALLDFDGYDYLKLGMNLDQVLNNEKRKMGHAFILAMLLEGKIQIKEGNIIVL